MLTKKDNVFNFIVGSLDMACFSLGVVIASITTLLPLFAKHIGATNVEIGLIPAIYYICLAIPSFLSPILGGKIADYYGFPKVFLVPLVINLIAILLLLRVKEPLTFKESKLD